MEIEVDRLKEAFKRSTGPVVEHDVGQPNVVGGNIQPADVTIVTGSP